ncbi:MAG: SUMF1/EgtB/PvdO family nonheme iron enzyme, partial [Myxococcota bacterium]
WSGAPPGASEARPIRVDVPVGAAGLAGQCAVPDGWAIVGGADTPRRRVWVDGFVIDRFPVTNLQYLAFLNDLVATGQADRAAAHVPRERTTADDGRPVFDLGPDGYALGVDEDGDAFAPDWPVVLIDWDDARAYAAWRSARDGLPWRLPSEWEWEKAARGVDGRRFPWGDHPEDTWCNSMHARAGRALVSPVDAFPVDESPYGVRGCAGNVHEWCLEARDAPLPDDGTAASLPSDDGSAPFRSVRGGAWHMAVRHAACGSRHSTQAHSRLPYLGFRCARTIG